MKNLSGIRVLLIPHSIAFFSPKKKKLLTNNQFIQNLNLISDKSTISAEKIFKVDALKSIVQFIDQQLEKPADYQDEEQPKVEIDLERENRYFNVKCVFFQDRSFEIVITDTSKLEKRRLIKQEMTSNISHELKTPVATVLGYLETLQQNSLEAEKHKYFINKAHAQAKRLSDLIEDISTLNKIEEAGDHYAFEAVNIRNIALHAAFLAANAGEPVHMAHLLRAARTEYSKLEKALTDAEIRGWI